MCISFAAFECWGGCLNYSAWCCSALDPTRRNIRGCLSCHSAWCCSALDPTGRNIRGCLSCHSAWCCSPLDAMGRKIRGGCLSCHSAWFCSPLDAMGRKMWGACSGGRHQLRRRYRSWRLPRENHSARVTDHYSNIPDNSNIFERV